MIDATRKTPNTSLRRGYAVRCVVIHATAGELGGALSWLTNVTSRVSADFVIDRSGRIWQINPDMRAWFTWHAGMSQWRGLAVQGSLNPVSVGVELVNRNDGRDPYPEAQLRSAILLTALLCHGFDIPVAHVCGHYECSPGRKTDPAGLDMDWFRNRVARALATLTSEGSGVQ